MRFIFFLFLEGKYGFYWNEEEGYRIFVLKKERYGLKIYKEQRIM